MFELVLRGQVRSRHVARNRLVFNIAFERMSRKNVTVLFMTNFSWLYILY